tara:strand:- start:105 stop:704 length:600 start_codon:yes stop_codon:yes gene_type:complete
MKYPESKQESETQEDFVRRISKFPTLQPNTIKRVVFPTVSRDAWEHVKGWAKLQFPKAFPPEDITGLPFINPENIPTKEFANWVVEKKIFEALIGLGQKVSPIAELFIDLVLGKTDNLAKHSGKPKDNSGRWAEAKKHRAAVRKIAKGLWKQNKDLTITGMTHHDEINIVKKSDGTNYSEGTLRKWTKDLAPSNKPGRR